MTDFMYSGTPLVNYSSKISYVPEMWPFKRDGLLSGVQIYAFMDLHCRLAFPEGLACHQGGLLKRVPLYDKLQFLYDKL